MNDEMTRLGLKPKHTQSGYQKIKCPNCQPPHNPKDRPLSLTIEEDGSFVYKCHHCDFAGGWKTSQSYKTKYLKDYIQPKKSFVKPERPKTVKRETFLYDFMQSRGISKNTSDSLKIYTEGKWIAFPYFDEESELINIKFRDTQKQFRQTPNAKRIIYNYDNVYKADTVIFVEGEMDVLALCEIGYTNSTTLPDGASKEAKFKENDARFMALQNCPLKAKKIIIFTDNDTAGRALHKELLHRFGKDKCWYVKAPEGCKDANEVLIKHGQQKLKEIIDNAIPYPIDGLFRASDYLNQVNDLYDGNYVKALEIGMDGLDDIYRILPSTFHCITGIPNHGKSVFLDQVLIKLAENHNWKFAIFSPEHSTSMHIRRMVQMLLGKGFDTNTNNRMTKSELLDAMQFIDKHFYFIESKDAVPDINFIIDISKNAVNKFGVNGIIIDPYNEVNAKREGNQREDEHIRDFISECKRFARTYEAVVWVVAHPTKLPKTTDGSYLPPSAYDISGAAHWHNQADVVLTVHRDFDDNSTRIITRKIREQDLYGKIGECRFIFDMKERRFINWQPVDDWSNIDFN